jgi:hypothetical protein
MLDSKLVQLKAAVTTTSSRPQVVQLRGAKAVFNPCDVSRMNFAVGREMWLSQNIT